MTPSSAIEAYIAHFGLNCLTHAQYRKHVKLFLKKVSNPENVDLSKIPEELSTLRDRLFKVMEPLVKFQELESEKEVITFVDIVDICKLWMATKSTSKSIVDFTNNHTMPMMLDILAGSGERPDGIEHASPGHIYSGFETGSEAFNVLYRTKHLWGPLHSQDTKGKLRNRFL